ncbi:MAG: hypothetical protein WA130_10990 [Candidatus Methanoperedens sp.]
MPAALTDDALEDVSLTALATLPILLFISNIVNSIPAASSIPMNPMPALNVLFSLFSGLTWIKLTLV